MNDRGNSAEQNDFYQKILYQTDAHLQHQRHEVINIEVSYNQILAHEAAFRASLVAQSMKNDLIISRQNIKQNGATSPLTNKKSTFETMPYQPVLMSQKQSILKSSPISPQIKVNVNIISRVSQEATLRAYLDPQYETELSSKRRSNLSKATKHLGYESVVSSPSKVQVPTDPLEQLLAATLQNKTSQRASAQNIPQPSSTQMKDSKHMKASNLSVKQEVKAVEISKNRMSCNNLKASQTKLASSSSQTKISGVQKFVQIKHQPRQVQLPPLPTFPTEAPTKEQPKNELSPVQPVPKHPASATLPYKHLTRITMNSRKYLEPQPIQTSQEITDRFKDNEKKKKLRDAEHKELEMRKNFRQNAAYQMPFSNTEYSTPGASSRYLDEYQIEEDSSLLGTGGYAEVRRAKHKKTGQLVAIKIYEKFRLLDSQVKANLVKEIKVLGRLNHPNIVRLYESIDSFSNVYLITEYLDGTPLNEHIKTLDGGKFSEKEAIEILQQLLAAVGYLHKKGICHRDIKLENIVIVETQPKTKIKLIDFGFAVFYGAQNPDHPLKLLCGTPSYMAPEMLAKKDYSGASIDIWTCGIAFYALLTGQLPFAAHTERDLYKKIQSGIYHIPQQLSRMSVLALQRMLAVNPQNRSSAEDILTSISSPFETEVTQGVAQNHFPSSLSKFDLMDCHVRLETYERHLRNRGADILIKQKTPVSPPANVAKHIDEDTVQQLVKLGYAENQIRSKFNDEQDILGKLYQRLLILKINQQTPLST